MPIKVLLIDDHTMITDFYKTTLSDLEIKTEITTVNSLKLAYQYIFNSNAPLFDIVVLDISMPPYLEKKINDGEDLAKLIREKHTNIKIIIITGYCNTLRLNNINKCIYPEGILEKCDVNYNVFISAFMHIINDNTYFSETVEKMQINDFSNIYLDSTNRKIIELLSQGVKTINIPLYLPITLSGVNKRKQKIKELLKIESGNNEDIIRESKIRGII
jgi:two-component system response regulator NreC